MAQEAEYADGWQLADNQNKYLILEQGESFHPFIYLDNIDEIGEFTSEDLNDASGLMFCIRKGVDELWIYQHLWSIMVPNKKKTNPMARLMHFENQIVFAEQRESLLTIAKKIDILIMNNHLITRNTVLLQKYFGFQDYIYQSAQQTVQSIAQKNLVENVEKLTEYINRGKPQYAKKMMRIGSSKVFDLTQEQLINKVNTLSRWQYTRSDVTDTEYDTDVKTVAAPAE